MRTIAWLACWILLPLGALALGPHEIVLLVNDASEDSGILAAEYATLRQVPTQNIVHVRVTLPADGALSPEAFTREIWDPAWETIRKRGISDHVLAWIYSAGFPVRVAGTPPMSLTGVTFVRNRIPDGAQVNAGTWVSPLYAGMAGPGIREVSEVPVAARAKSFDVYAAWLRNDMPLPSMMLAYTGERGNTREEVRQYLSAGARSDGTMPTGTVYLLTSDDVRSLCRQWQFPIVRDQLAVLGIQVVVTDQVPAGARVIGLLSGAAQVVPPTNVVYLPGAVADHLTSEAALFETGTQTKLTAWLRVGATASAGTIVEPFANWKKFPSAFLFCHYAAGCTLIESFYQSVRSPFQILPIGEPLAQPWAPTGRVTIAVQPEGVIAGSLHVTVSVIRTPGTYYREGLLLLDGRTVGTGFSGTLDTTKYEDGDHRLRAVVYPAGLVKSQLFAECTVRFRNRPGGRE